MSVLKKNILFNLIGSASVILLSLLIIPVQIKHLGFEAYGLVGLMATLQMMFSIFDIALSFTITRYIAMDSKFLEEETKYIVSTAHVIYWFVGICILVSIIYLSKTIAHEWFSNSRISINILIDSILIIAICIAMRPPISFYNGVLSGLQKHNIINVIKFISALIRLGGGLLVILIYENILMFMYWFVISVFFELMLYFHACKKNIPNNFLSFKLYPSSLKIILKFSIYMKIIALLLMVIINADRVLISKLLSLEELGYYYLAYNLAAGLAVIQVSITNALYPSLANKHNDGYIKLINDKYFDTSQLMTYLVALPTFFLIFYGKECLSFWVGYEAASRSSMVLSLLAFGFLINSIASVSYITAIATGSPSLIMKVNLCALFFYLPILSWLIYNFSICGAAIGWLLLNLYYLFVQAPLVHRKILLTNYYSWLLKYILPIIFFALICFVLSKFVLVLFLDLKSIYDFSFVLLLLMLAYVFYGYKMLSDSNKESLQRVILRNTSHI